MIIHDELDDKWIPEVANRKWAILTDDKSIAVVPLNRAAVLSSNAQVIIVGDTNSLPEQWAASIIVGRVRLLELLDKHPGPVFIRVGRYAKDHINAIKDDRSGKNHEDKKQESASIDPGSADIQRSGDGHSQGETGTEGSKFTVSTSSDESGKDQTQKDAISNGRMPIAGQAAENPSP